eukprot:6730031-Karenia_brevis.AAC.1
MEHGSIRNMLPKAVSISVFMNAYKAWKQHGCLATGSTLGKSVRIFIPMYTSVASDMKKAGI